MDIESLLIIGVAPALIFYVIVPLVGAFSVRRRWRKFRREVIAASALTRLDYAVTQGTPDDETSVAVSFFGRLEGIEGRQGIWLGSKGISVSVDLSGVRLFLLPQQEEHATAPPDSSPRVAYWKEMNALVEGSRFFVAGEVRRNQNGSLSIGTSEGSGNTLLAIMYDGADDTVFSRAIWTGRQRNEFWNHLTPISLIVGFLAEFLWVVRVFDENRLYALVGIILAVLPVLPLVPPGVLGFYLYRRLWQKGRRIRATRDLEILRDSVDGSDPEFKKKKTIDATMNELAGTAALIAGLFINTYIGAVILAILLR